MARSFPAPVLGLVKDGPDALGAFGDASLQAMS